MDNAQLARRLDELGVLLDAQDASPFRTRAYRDAARVVRELDRPARRILETDGIEGLTHLPKIGRSIAHTIGQLLKTGTCPLLEQLHGIADPERMLATVPGLGRALASRIHERLGIETLADLEAAAWDGRLARLPGIGLRRVRAVRESLAGRLGAGRTWPARPANHGQQPDVSELLGIDEEYRRKAAADRLPRIAPHRFNPTHQAWLPILHTARNGRHYTALFSNTARAHRLGTTQDWVIIYRDDHEGHGQWTIITARLGRMRGRRIVRGREDECWECFESLSGEQART